MEHAMETREIVLLIFFGLILISTLIVTLIKSDQMISFRFFFVKYEGSLVALWPIAALIVLVSLFIGQHELQF
jgi:hypothetical protein